jgi:hypothetical protein
MNEGTNRPDIVGGADRGRSEGSLSANETANLTPTIVLSLLEADQMVAAKQQTRFGPRTLSSGSRVLLWGLRVYVVIMLVIVVISVVRATHPIP